MRFSVSQTLLNEALSIVARGLSSQNTVAILAGVLLDAHDGTLTLQTTNLKVSIQHKVSALIEEEGSVVVSGALLSKIVKTLPQENVTCVQEGTLVTLTCSKSSFVLATLPVEDFPEFPSPSASQTIELPTKLLSEMVEKVYRVTKDDVTNPILAGITLTAQENKLSMYATDSHRLAIIDTHTETSSIEGEFTAIIPASAFHEMLSLPSISDTITLGISDNQIICSYLNTTFITLKIEGILPDFKRLFPTTCTTKLTCNPVLLADAIKRVAVVTTANDLGIEFSLDPVKQTLTLKAESLEYGTSKETMTVSIEGEPMVFSMNYQFMLECTKASTSKHELIFEIVNNMQPVVIKSFGDINYQCLLIPLRTN